MSKSSGIARSGSSSSSQTPPMVPLASTKPLSLKSTGSNGSSGSATRPTTPKPPRRRSDASSGRASSQAPRSGVDLDVQAAKLALEDKNIPLFQSRLARLTSTEALTYQRDKADHTILSYMLVEGRDTPKASQVTYKHLCSLSPKPKNLLKDVLYTCEAYKVLIYSFLDNNVHALKLLQEQGGEDHLSYFEKDPSLLNWMPQKASLEMIQFIWPALSKMEDEDVHSAVLRIAPPDGFPWLVSTFPADVIQRSYVSMIRRALDKDQPAYLQQLLSHKQFKIPPDALNDWVKEASPNAVVVLIGSGRVDQEPLRRLGFTALHFAAAKGHIHSVKDIVRRDPGSCHVKDASGKTAIHYAITHGHVDVVRILATTPEVMPQGHKPVQKGLPLIVVACMAEKEDVVTELLALGVDSVPSSCVCQVFGGKLELDLSRLKDQAHLLVKLIRSPEHVWSKCTLDDEQQLQFMKLTWKHPDSGVTATGIDWNQAMNYATLQSHKKSLEFLVGKISLTTRWKGTAPIEVIARSSTPNVLRYTLGLPGLNLDYKNERDEPLILIMSQGNSVSDRIRVALEVQPSLMHSRYKTGPMGLLRYLGAKGTLYERDLPYLIDVLGVDPNAQDENGDTVMHSFAGRGYGAACFHVRRDLATHPKSNPNIRNSNGRTPLSLASQEYQPRFVRAFLEYPDIDVNTVDKLGNGVLHYALTQPRYDDEIMMDLINAGANVLVRNHTGASILMSWRFSPPNSVKMMFLALVGAELIGSIVDNDGNTALHYLSMKLDPWQLNEGLEYARILVTRFGVKIRSKNKHGHTAVQLAHERSGLSSLGAALEALADEKYYTSGEQEDSQPDPISKSVAGMFLPKNALKNTLARAKTAVQRVASLRQSLVQIPYDDIEWKNAKRGVKVYVPL